MMNIVFNDTLGELVLYDFYKTKKKSQVEKNVKCTSTTSDKSS